MALAALASGAGLSPEVIRESRDDARAPQAELPAAALRRVWWWGVGGACGSRRATPALGANYRTITRARRLVESWYERDAATADALDAYAGLCAALVTVATTRTLPALAARQAIRDRSSLEQARATQKAKAKAVGASQTSRLMMTLAKEARAAGATARAEHLEELARTPRPAPIRTRDLARARAPVSAL